MYGEPEAAQLLQAVIGYLEKTAVPALEGRAAFHGKVAINALIIVQRELTMGADAQARELAGLQALLDRPAEVDLLSLRAALCDRIARGEIVAETPGLLAHLISTAADRVAIEQPNYSSLKLAAR
jgi:hypothetical protein